jgi:hypothetical protein
MQMPFQWGPSGQKLTPSQAKAMRDVASALAARKGTPQNVGEGLASVGDALLYNSNMARAGEAESAGMSQVAQALADARASGGSDGFLDVMGNEWASPAQQLVAGELYKRSIPEWQTFESGGDILRWNQNDPESQPSVFYDGPDQGPEFRTLAAEEAAQLGLPPGAYQQGADGKISQIGGGGVTVNTGENTSAFTKKADELAAGRMSEIVTAGQGAQSFMGDINTLAEIGKTLQTGKRAEAMAMVGPFAEAIGIDVEGLGEAEAYEAIISRMAPAMRIPGSGASSDFDAKQFLRSLPALGNSPEGNAIIEQTFTAIQQTKMAAMDIANRALSGEISWNEADKQIANLGDPFTAFNDYRAKTKGGNKDAAMSSGNGWKVISVE